MVVIADPRIESCVRSGGLWDPTNKHCIMPKSEKEPEKEPEPTKLTPAQKHKAMQERSVITTDAQGNEIIQTRVDVEREIAVQKGGPGARELIETQKQETIVNLEEKEEFEEAVRLAEEGLPLSSKQEQLLRQGGPQEPQGMMERLGTRAADFVEPAGEKIISKVPGLRNLLSGMSEEEMDNLEVGVGGVAVLGLTILTGVGVAYGVGTILSGLGVSKGGMILGVTVLTGLSTDKIVDMALGRADTSQIQSSINTAAQVTPTIVGLVESGGLTAAQGIAEINRLERDVDILEMEIQQAIILDPSIRTSGELNDILMDIIDARNIFRESRASIISSQPQFNALETISLLDTFQKQAGTEGHDIGLTKDVLEV